MTQESARFVLILSCPNRIGIVYVVSKFLYERQCNITESGQFDDPDTGEFFMRIAFTEGDVKRGISCLRDAFSELASTFEMDWTLHDESVRLKTLVMVSKFDHCLVDLLYRRDIGELPIEIVAIVSNHQSCYEIAERHGVPFVYLPVERDTKTDQENALLELVNRNGAELIVLARYMQILSDEFCKKIPCPAINIHHSFLPSFKGAKPYHQAHQRGVKLIGATAHYVTADLDEGPIIEQGVQRVDHCYSAAQLITIGRDIERQVLARAVKLQSEHRVLLNGEKTVVFG